MLHQCLFPLIVFWCKDIVMEKWIVDFWCKDIVMEKWIVEMENDNKTLVDHPSYLLLPIVIIIIYCQTIYSKTKNTNAYNRLLWLICSTVSLFLRPNLAWGIHKEQWWRHASMVLWMGNGWIGQGLVVWLVL